MGGVVLYDNGDEKTAVTGGWDTYSVSGYTTPTLTKNPTYLYEYASVRNAVGGFYAVNKIDFTQYTKLKAQATTLYGSTSYTRLNVVLTDTLPTSANPENSPIVYGQLTGNNTETIDEIDISSVTGSRYLALHCNAYGSVKSSIYKVWLE